MWREGWQHFLESTLPFCTSSASRPLHSLRKTLAPVRLPSPPHTHRLVMPLFTRLKAAESRPSRVVKALHRALPITVPPCSITCQNPNQDKRDIVIIKYITLNHRYLILIFETLDIWDGSFRLDPMWTGIGKVSDWKWVCTLIYALDLCLLTRHYLWLRESTKQFPDCPYLPGS